VTSCTGTVVRRAGMVVVLLLSVGGVAQAQTTVLLPDSSQTSVVSVTVSEQARVAVPAGISFTVNNVGAATSANSAAVTIDQIVMSSAAKQLRLSLRADAAAFTAPAVGETSWAANDVSWGAATWTAATGTAGVLSNATFNTVATCNAGVTACSTTGLVFSLAAKPSVQRSGTHTLLVTWKVESIGS
jgi:hypothetical protein